MPQNRYSRLKSALGKAAGTPEPAALSAPGGGAYISRVIADNARRRAAEAGFRAGGASEREAQAYYKEAQETPARSARALKILGGDEAKIPLNVGVNKRKR